MTFRPLVTSNSDSTNLAQINDMVRQINKEQVTKTFKGPSGKPLIVTGKLQHGFYGTAYLDTSGNTVKLVGFDTTGAFIELNVKAGYDAYTVLGY